MRRRVFIGFALLALSYLAFANITSALAQAGNAGGTIGKQDKSISGGQERTDSHRPEQTRSERQIDTRSNAKESFPRTIRLNEHAILEFSITLERTGGNSYKGTWSHGYATTFTVTSFTKNSLNMMRRDNPALGSVSGTYTGQRSGNSASGEAAISNGFRSTWDATWP